MTTPVDHQQRGTLGSTRDQRGRAVGACTSCGAGLAVDGVTGGTRGACANCGTMVTLHYVYGERSETPCDGACMAAIGHICACACGGANHGRWNVPIELVGVWEADPVKAEKERTRARAHQAKRIADHAQRAERKAAAAADQAAAGQAALLAKYPVLAHLADLAWFNLNAYGRFMDDMRDAFARGDMTPRQAEAAAAAIVRTNERAERRAKIEADKAAVRASGAAVKAGRYVITGVIVSAKEQDDQYSFHGGTIVKITVRQADGTAVWGTLPKSAWDAEAPTIRGQEAFAAWFRGLTGREITFTGTVAPKDDDVTFGFFKRPAKIVLGDRAE